MKQGRPPKSLDEFDKDLISINLSFNDVKHLLQSFQNYQPSSVEGQVSKKLLEGLKKYLIRRQKEGKLPKEIIDKYVIKKESKIIDKSNIIKNKQKDTENG